MSILGAFQAAQQSANIANLQRYKQGIGIYDEIIKNWGKGGGFVKGAEATLARTKKKDIAGGMQNLVSSGLAGTTMAAGIGKKWEEEVGAPSRLSIADIAGQRLAQAMEGKAGFIERRQDTGPDPGMVSSLMQGVGQSTGGYGSYNQPYGSEFMPSKGQPGYRATRSTGVNPYTNASSAGTVYGKAKPTTTAWSSYKAPTGTQVGSSYYGAAYKPKQSTLQSSYQKLATKMGGKTSAGGWASIQKASKLWQASKK